MTRSAEVTWGATLCERDACAEPAECVFEGMALCLEHADDLLDRLVAHELNPEAVAMMPAWDAVEPEELERRRGEERARYQRWFEERRP